MAAYRICLPILLAAAVSGCHSFGPLVKRDSEMNCPTDIRRTVPWCWGEDAIFHCPCGPDGPYYGHKPTCWRTWPTAATVWRDSYCGQGACGEAPCAVATPMMIVDEQVIVLPQPDEAMPPVETVQPEEAPQPAEATPPTVDQPTEEQPAPAVLENPVEDSVAPPAVLEPLPPTSQALPIESSQPTAVAYRVPAAPKCGAPLQGDVLPPPPVRVVRRTLAAGFARALSPRRDQPKMAAKPAPASTPIETASYAVTPPTNGGVSTEPARDVAIAVLDRPVRAPVITAEAPETTLSILPEVPTNSEATIVVPARAAPVVTPPAQPAANQGTGGWIFVR